MKKVLLRISNALLIIFHFVIAFCNINQSNGQTAASVSIGTSRTLPDYFCGDNGTNTIQEDQGYNCFNDPNNLYDQYINKLGITNIRYPGGTVANFHDWRKGYFLKKLPTGFNIPKNYEALTKAWYDPAPWTGCKPVNTLTEMRKTFFKIGGDVLFNLNILTSDINYQMAMLYHARELNLPVRSIELGNEFYLSDENNYYRFPTVIDYAEEAINWATAIKNDLGFSGNPPIIAAVGADSKSADPGRRRLWLDNLLYEFSQNSNSSNIDAVTLHVYSGGGIEKYSLCGSNVPSNFIWNASYTTECYCMLGKFFNQAFISSDNLLANEIAKISSAQKKAWITEYNLFDKDENYAVHGTWAQGLFASSMTLSYLETEDITKINMHTMIGDAVWSNVFSNNQGFDFIDGFASPCSPCTTTAWDYTAIGNAMYLINNAMKGATDVSKLTFSASPPIPDIDPTYTFVSHPVLYGYAFEKPDSNETVILNLGDDPYTVNISDVLPTTTYASYSYYQMAGDPFNAITGNAIYSLTSNALTGSNAGTTNLLQYFFDDNPGTSVELPGYSIVVLRGIKSTNLKLTATADVICNNPDPDMFSNCSYNHSETSVIASGGTPPYSYSINGANATVTEDVNYNHIAYVELDAGMPPITSPLVFDVIVTDNLGTSASSSITINPSFALSLNPSCGGTYAICVGEAITLEANTYLPTQTNYSSSCNFIWTPSNGLNCNNCSSVNVTPHYSDSYSVYVTDGTCFVSNEINQIIVKYGPVINSILPNDPVICNNTSHDIVLVVDCDETGFTLEWTDPLLNTYNTTDLTLNSSSAATGVYIATVTSSNQCTATYSVSLSSISCCTSTNTNDYVIYPGDYLLSDVLPSNNITNKFLYINGNIHVDKSFTDKKVIFEDCRFVFGENSKIIIDPKCKMEVNGDFDFSTCGNWLWQGIEIADSRSTLILNGNSTSNAYIADAESAINASRDAKVILNNTTFNNNHYHIKLKDYYDDPDPATGLNIRGNVFTSNSVKTYNDFTLSCIDLNNVLNAPIGMNGTGNGNEFYNAYGGIKAYDAGMTVYNNKFVNLLPGSAASIEAAQPNFYNEKKINIGLSDNFGKLNLFDNIAFGIVIYGEYNVAIGRNNFKTLTGTPQRSIDIAIADNVTKPVEIAHCSMFDFKQGIYIADAGHEEDANPWIKIHHNEIADAVSTTGSDGIGINVANGTQHVSRVAIYDNYILEPRIGISMTKIDGAKIYKESTGNKIQFRFNATQTLSNVFAGIELNECDNVFIHENSVTNKITNPSSNLRGLNVTESEGGNYCSNFIDSIGYSIYFKDNCSGSILKKNTSLNYEKAIYFSNAYFSQQGVNNSQTWENVFDDNLTNKRLDGNILNSSFFYWYYNSTNTAMDISGGYNNIPLKIFPVGISGYGITDCDNLPLRFANHDSISQLINDFVLFPNPANDHIIVQSLTETEVNNELIISDIIGRTVTSMKMTSPTSLISLASFPPGIYSLLIYKESEIVTVKKFIIQN